MSRRGKTTMKGRQEEPKLSRRQETLKVTSERAQQAQRRSQQCFLSMIEAPVDPQQFVTTARYINPEVYSDVVLERAVAGLCGYPVCHNTFTDTYGSRTYVIRSNKLYDISGRRNFCSNVCYEASELVRRQVSTLPLYLRDTDEEDLKDIHLPDLTRLKGRHGKMVDITGGIENIEVNEEKKSRTKTAAFTTIDDIARESLINWTENEIEERASKNHKTEEKEENIENKERSKHDVDGRTEKSDSSGNKKTHKSRKETGKGDPNDDAKKETVTNSIDDVFKVECVLRQWVSFDSLRIVLGDLYLRGMLEHIGHSWENYDTTKGMRLSVEAKARYIAICRRLEHEERQEEEERDAVSQHQALEHTKATHPLPDYRNLQRDAKKQQLKVVSFLGGSEQYEETIEKLDVIPEDAEAEAQSNSKSKKPLQDSDTSEPTLPFVDSYSQAAWRQSIVLEKVTVYLEQMLEMTKLSVHEVRKLIASLVATFHLSPNNISFRPIQWRLVTLILLKLLSVRYPIIQDSLRTQEGLDMQKAILSSYSLDLGYTDRALSYLTEIQHVLSKDFRNDQTEPEVAKTYDAGLPPQPDKVEKDANINTSKLNEDMAQVRISDNSVD